MFRHVRKKFGEYLIEKNKITSEHVQQALAYQSEHKELRIGEIFHKLQILDKEEVLRELAGYLEKDYVTLEGITIPQDLKDVFSLDFMQSNSFAPFEQFGSTIKIAINDINNFELKSHIDSIASRKNFSTEYYLCLGEVIREYIEVSFIDKVSTEKDIPQLVDYIIEDGTRRNCSDIHIEPVNNEKIRIRYRIDGQMVLSRINIPKEEYDEVVSRIKILANLNTTERRRSQDGHISDFKSQSGKLFDIRVSIVLVSYGEEIVLRLLNKNEKIRDLKELGFGQNQISVINKNIRHKNGIVFVTGATGMGKSTTLYTILNMLNRVNLKIITLENPVERTIEGLNQININETIGISFSNTLRTVLRQDPDVIMVGEIRDRETLSIALEASMTGHLVLTTLHTNSAIQIIDRVNSMGIDMYNFASSLLLVVSQKLIRKLCSHCKEKYAPTREELAYMEKVSNTSLGKSVKIYRSVGCARCNQGYLGREVVCEMFEKDENIEQMLTRNASSTEVLAYLNNTGYSYMVRQAVDKVLTGITSLEEVRSTFAD